MARLLSSLTLPFFIVLSVSAFAAQQPPSNASKNTVKPFEIKPYKSETGIKQAAKNKSKTIHGFEVKPYEGMKSPKTKTAQTFEIKPYEESVKPQKANKISSNKVIPNKVNQGAEVKPIEAVKTPVDPEKTAIKTSKVKAQAEKKKVVKVEPAAVVPAIAAPESVSVPESVSSNGSPTAKSLSRHKNSRRAMMNEMAVPGSAKGDRTVHYQFIPKEKIVAVEPPEMPVTPSVAPTEKTNIKPSAPIQEAKKPVAAQVKKEQRKTPVIAQPEVIEPESTASPESVQKSFVKTQAHSIRAERPNSGKVIRAIEDNKKETYHWRRVNSPHQHLDESKAVVAVQKHKLQQ